MIKQSACSLSKRLSTYKKVLYAGVGIGAGVVVLSTVLPQGGPATGGHKQATGAWSAAAYVSDVIANSSAGTAARDARTAAAAALRTATALALARCCEDADTRDALLNFGPTTRLLDFLLTTCADEHPGTPAQTAAEQALCHLLGSPRLAAHLLARPGAIPRLLDLCAGGRASDSLSDAMSAAAAAAAAASAAAPAGSVHPLPPPPLRLDDGAAVLALLTGQQGSQVQQLAGSFLLGWARASSDNRQALAALGLNPALAGAAMDAVASGEASRTVQLLACRLIRAMALDPSASTDADVAAWARPTLFAAADAAAAGDLALADEAMHSLAACARRGGPVVGSALRQLHLMPTLECLALSSDARLRGRAAASLAPLVRLGLVGGPGEGVRWRERLLGWVVEADCVGGEVGGGSAAGSGGAAPRGASGAGGGTALRKGCVAALRALAGEAGVPGLTVSHYWLATLLGHLGGRGGGLQAPGAAAQQQQQLSARGWQQQQQEGADEGPPPGDAVSVARAAAAAAATQLRAAAAAAAASADARAAGVLVLPQEVDPGLLAPAVLEAYPAVAAAVDVALAQRAACTALEALCQVAAADAGTHGWLVEVGVLHLLERLVRAAASADGDGPLGGGGRRFGAARGAAAPAGASGGSGRGRVGGVDGEGPPGFEGDALAGARRAAGAQLAHVKSSSSGRLEWQAVGGGGYSQECCSGSGGGGGGGSGGGAAALRMERVDYLRAALAGGVAAPSSWWRARWAAAAVQPAAAQPGGAGAAAAAMSGTRDGGGGGGDDGEDGLSRTAAVAAAAESAEGFALDDSPELCVQRQAARLLAMLCLQPDAARQVARGGWLAWLADAAAGDDCRLSSYATVALLHLEGALDGGAAAHPAGSGASGASELAALLEELWPFGGAAAAGCGGAGAAAAAGQPPLSFPDGVHLMCPWKGHHWSLTRGARARARRGGGSALQVIASAAAEAAEAAALSAASDLGQSEIEEVGDIGGAAAPPTPLAAALLWAASLVGGTPPPPQRPATPPPQRPATPPPSPGGNAAPCIGPPDSILAGEPEPAFDVVFVHGIRGGPFVTWRCGGVFGHGSASRHLRHEQCWPAAWLAEEFPDARLLSVEYQAPVTGWEGDSLSLPDNVRLMTDKLLAAGVGQRPVVWVAHSMGGLLVKEMLALGLAEPAAAAAADGRAALAAATAGAVFYATPHFGSPMAALGWKLRHVPGTAVAPAVHHLAPGPRLARLNEQLRELHASPAGLPVLSFVEGLPTPLSGLLPRLLIVPFESGYPGFGEVVVLPELDHIGVCKPDSRGAAGYRRLVKFIEAAVGSERVGRAAAGGGVWGGADADAGAGAEVVGGGGGGGAARGAARADAGGWRGSGGAAAGSVSGGGTVTEVHCTPIAAGAGPDRHGVAGAVAAAGGPASAAAAPSGTASGSGPSSGCGGVSGAAAAGGGQAGQQAAQQWQWGDSAGTRSCGRANASLPSGALLHAQRSTAAR